MEKNELEKNYRMLLKKVRNYEERISNDFDSVDQDKFSDDDKLFLKRLAAEIYICNTRLNMIDFESDDYDNDVTAIQLCVLNEKRKRILSSIEEFENKFDINLEKAEVTCENEENEEMDDEIENPVIKNLRIFSRSLIGVAAAITIVGAGVGIYKNLSKNTPKIKTLKEKTPIVTASEEEKILTDTDEIKKVVEEEISQDELDDDISKYTVTFEDKEKDDTKSVGKNELISEDDEKENKEDFIYDETYPNTIIPQEYDEQVEDTYYDRDDIVEKDGEVWVEPPSEEPTNENSEFYTAPDGTIWESEEEYNNYVNGEQTEEIVQPTDEEGMVERDYYVAPDGTIWSNEEEYNNYVNEEQTEEIVQPTDEETKDESIDNEFYTAPDGTIWSSEEEYNNYVNGEQTEEMGQSSNEEIKDESIDNEFYTAPDGTIWSSEEDYNNYQKHIVEEEKPKNEELDENNDLEVSSTTNDNDTTYSNENYYTAPDGTVWANEEDYNNSLQINEQDDIGGSSSNEIIEQNDELETEFYVVVNENGEKEYWASYEDWAACNLAESYQKTL